MGNYYTHSKGKSYFENSKTTASGGAVVKDARLSQNTNEYRKSKVKVVVRRYVVKQD